VHAIDNGVKHLPSRTGESEAAGLVRELSALREGISALQPARDARIGASTGRSKRTHQRHERREP
jgi:hypothetical protein